MLKPISIFLFGAYVLPFIYLYNSNFLFEYLILISFLLAFVLPYFLFYKRDEKKSAYDHSYLLVEKNIFIDFLFIIFCILKFTEISAAATAFLNGEIQIFMFENALSRYEGNSNSGASKQVALAIYFAILGLCGFTSHRKKYLFYILFSTLILSLSLSRASVLLGLAIYISARFIVYNQYLHNMSVAKLVKKSFFIILILSSIFLFSAYFRVYDAESPLNIVLDKLPSYSIALHEALLIWMQTENIFYDQFGIQHFTIFYDLFGYDFKAGTYEAVYTSYGYTNVFTSLRGLLEGFGYIGTIILILLASYTFNLTTYRKLNLITLILLHAMLCNLIFFFYSPFYFNSFLFGFLLTHLMRIKIAI